MKCGQHGSRPVAPMQKCRQSKRELEWRWLRPLSPEARRIRRCEVDKNSGAQRDSVALLPRHLDHRAPEPRASKEALRGLVSLCRRKHDLRHTARLELCQRRVDKLPADAVPAVRRIDHDVVQHARGPAQRHEIVPLDPSVRVAEHFAVHLGDEHDDVRLLELCSDERAVSLLGLWGGGDEALGVKIVVQPNEARAESADGRQVRARGAANAERGVAQAPGGFGAVDASPGVTTSFRAIPAILCDSSDIGQKTSYVPGFNVTVSVADWLTGISRVALSTPFPLTENACVIEPLFFT